MSSIAPIEALGSAIARQHNWGNVRPCSCWQDVSDTVQQLLELSAIQRTDAHELLHMIFMHTYALYDLSLKRGS